MHCLPSGTAAALHVVSKRPIGLRIVEVSDAWKSEKTVKTGNLTLTNGSQYPLSRFLVWGQASRSSYWVMNKNNHHSQYICDFYYEINTTCFGSNWAIIRCVEKALTNILATEVEKELYQYIQQTV
jgi:hypothetical protein